MAKHKKIALKPYQADSRRTNEKAPLSGGLVMSVIRQ